MRNASAWLLLGTLALCALQAHSRGLRQLQPVLTAPSSNTLNLRSSDSNASSDLRRLLNNSLLMQLATSRSETLSLSEPASPNATAILLRSRPQPDRQRIQAAVEQIIEAWGSTDIRRLLATDFYDGDRLSQTLISQIPTDAKLELLRLEDFRLIQDSVISIETGEQARVWLVVADAITQIELNAAIAGYLTLRGRQRFTLRLFDLALQRATHTAALPIPFPKEITP